MSLPGLYWMSEDVAYPSSITTSFLGDVDFEAALSRTNSWSRWLVVTMGWFAV